MTEALLRPAAAGPMTAKWNCAERAGTGAAQHPLLEHRPQPSGVLGRAERVGGFELCQAIQIL
jgi:hypothetical protein